MPWPKTKGPTRQPTTTNASLNLRPDHAEADHNLGLLRVEQGRPAEAVVLLEHALRVKPDYVDAHNNLGLALADLGRGEEAIACSARPCGPPNNAEFYSNYGTALAALGRTMRPSPATPRLCRLRRGYPEARWHQAPDLADAKAT